MDAPSPRPDGRLRHITQTRYDARGVNISFAGCAGGWGGAKLAAATHGTLKELVMTRTSLTVEDILDEEDQQPNPEAFPPVSARQEVQ